MRISELTICIFFSVIVMTFSIDRHLFIQMLLHCHGCDCIITSGGDILIPVLYCSTGDTTGCIVAYDTDVLLPIDSIALPLTPLTVL